jgi:predicted  nucleic acid-binding Zn-ribbon protein
MNHKCIKCGKEYQSDDIDPYLCAECLVLKEKIAKEIDAKFANRPKKEGQSFNDKVKGMKTVNGITMINL